MNKIVLIGALVFSFQISCAQITWIPKAGLTISEIKTKIDGPDGGTEFNSGSSSTKLGTTVGIGINMPITKALSLQPELSFIQKGYAASAYVSVAVDGNVLEYYNTESKVTLNYLEMPVLGKYTVSLAKGTTQLFIVAGPSFALGVGGKLKRETTLYNSGTTTTTSRESKVKFGSDEISSDKYVVERRGDIGLQTGIGAILFKKIMVDVRYTRGMTKLWDTDGISIKNRVFQFTVGVPFTLKK